MRFDRVSCENGLNGKNLLLDLTRLQTRGKKAYSGDGAVKNIHACLFLNDFYVDFSGGFSSGISGGISHDFTLCTHFISKLL